MKLLTKEIIKRLPKLLATEGTPARDKIVRCKFFTPDNNWTWYVVEGEESEGGWVFFGWVHGLEREWGYFSLRELEQSRGPLGLPIERDMYFKPCRVEELQL